MSGPVALVGSGEYLPVMAPLEQRLMEQRPHRYVQLPTAAAPEGEKVVSRWLRLGAEQAARIGVEAVGLRVIDRASADDDALAASVAGAGLIYLSGGNPAYLASTLRETAVWRAIEATWRGGAALAGCSAGAMALCQWTADIRRVGAEPLPGLAVVPRLRVIPHFDRIARRRPQLAEEVASGLAEGEVLVGIDEETALVNWAGDLNCWRVEGRQRVWLVTATEALAHSEGQELTL